MSEHAPPSAEVAADLDRAVGAYLGLLTGERVSETLHGVTVVASVDGELTDLEIEPYVLRQQSAARLGETILAAIRAVTATAAERRAEIAETVKVLDEPVLELARQLQEDPVGTAQRLSRPRW